MRTPLFSFRNIEKRFGERILLQIEDLTLTEGECILMSGDNGAGKTVLLKIVAGLIAPDSATVVMNGMRLRWRNALRHLRRYVAYVHETPYMLDASVADNVAYGLRSQRFPRDQIGERVQQSLRWARLDHLAHRNATTLSSGERQRVALVRARLAAKRLLVLDNPVANMDPRARRQTFELIEALSTQGVGVLVTGNELEPLRAISHHQLRLEAGRLLSEQTTWRKSHIGAKVTPFPKRNA